MFELDDIYFYIRENLKEQRIAKTIVKKIKEKIRILNDFPFAYKLIKKTKNFEYRKFIIKNYIIIYKINLKEKEINILHIYNQKQKIKNKKEYIKI
ncbi:MAG: type II toxin-antitoxin system RelE/ParE family toxin [Clostridia bacterium]|nr:type II toxin-antitoxin system RelE/ParE family toxin [Clostridia bacterium]